MTRDELILLVEDILDFDGSEEELEDLIEELHANVLDPAVTNLIYHHPEELTAEQIVDRALAYQPIVVGP